MLRSVWQIVLALLLGVVLFGTALGVDAKPTPPGQPEIGPGGREYAFAGKRVTLYGKGAGAFYIAEPRKRADKPLPVVVFVHGMGLVQYNAYSAWIDHLVRKGSVVIYPVYHGTGIVDPKTFTDTAAAAIVKAINKCDGIQHATIDTDRMTMVGHSLGGTIIANLAARPKHFGLPTPKALMLLQPGDTKADNGLGAFMPSMTEDHSTIPAGTLMLIVDVENDYYVSPKAGLRIYHSAEQVEPSGKGRLLLRDDTHGKPGLPANHYLPMAWNTTTGQGRTDAYDFALWRWFDALQATAHGDEDQRKFVLGNTPEQRDMGQWSDGKAVREPEVYEPAKQR